MAGGARDGRASPRIVALRRDHRDPLRRARPPCWWRSPRCTARPSRRSRRRCARSGPSLVPEETLESAFAFDAIQLELVFVVGPLIAAGLATAISPAAGMLLCAGFYLVAAGGVRDRPGGPRRRPASSVERTRAGALRLPRHAHARAGGRHHGDLVRRARGGAHRLRGGGGLARGGGPARSPSGRSGR